MYAGSPTSRLLTLFLVVAPVTYLLADFLYAVRGWDDPTAAVFHVLGAVGYSFALLAIVAMLDQRSTGAAVVLFVSMVGVAGNVAYGFNTIHVALGDTDLVDASGAATLIKPLGLFFPLALLLGAVALRRSAVSQPWVAVLLGGAGLVWPIAHIANIGWLAVVVNLALVVSLGELAHRRWSLLKEPLTARDKASFSGDEVST